MSNSTHTNFISSFLRTTSLAVVTVGALGIANGTHAASMTVKASANAYAGAPVMDVFVNNKKITSKSVTTQHGTGSQTFTFGIPDHMLSGGYEEFEIIYSNDAFKSWPSQDRNLFIQEVKIDGKNIDLSKAVYSGSSYNKFANNEAAMLTNGELGFALEVERSTSSSSSSSNNSSSSGNNQSSSSSGNQTLVIKAAGDAYNGYPNMVVKVDGKTIANQSVDANNRSGQKKDYRFSWSSSKSADTLSVGFTNDAWGGNYTKDRNLYVYDVKLNGKDVSVGNNTSGSSYKVDNKGGFYFHSGGTINIALDGSGNSSSSNSSSSNDSSASNNDHSNHANHNTSSPSGSLERAPSWLVSALGGFVDGSGKVSAMYVSGLGHQGHSMGHPMNVHAVYGSAKALGINPDNFIRGFVQNGGNYNPGQMNDKRHIGALVVLNELAALQTMNGPNGDPNTLELFQGSATKAALNNNGSELRRLLNSRNGYLANLSNSDLVTIWSTNAHLYNHAILNVTTDCFKLTHLRSLNDNARDGTVPGTRGGYNDKGEYPERSSYRYQFFDYAKSCAAKHL